ncbi:hypothetical protein D515_04018 [Grimontia indica]|uniref:Uncharacterized protein n=1 Tax=Grimontia indica TaxID=1056512 RepID=R1IIQ5_9GAMM|nr:hypothetical protein D515_04018 [Grimontia indica]
MFSLFKDRTAKKLKKKHSMLLEQAMQAQRRGGHQNVFKTDRRS